MKLFICTLKKEAPLTIPLSSEAGRRIKFLTTTSGKTRKLARALARQAELRAQKNEAKWLQALKEQSVREAKLVAILTRALSGLNRLHEVRNERRSDI